MKKKPHENRRSHVKSEPTGIFSLDSQSAIAEFRKFKPNAVIESDEKTARLKLAPKDYDVFFEEAGNRERDLVVALDHITDPRNLGAIVRSAAFFGIKEIIVPNDRQATLTQASVATSMGGFALCDLVCVVNLNRALMELKHADYWIVGADMGGESASAVAKKYEKICLVLGSENKGLSRTVREKCDLIVGISSPAKGLESLNVAVAAGILMSQMKA